jgi:hypothetical protein
MKADDFREIFVRSTRFSIVEQLTRLFNIDDSAVPHKISAVASIIDEFFVKTLN